MSQENVPTTSQEVNSQEMAMHFGLPPPEPLDLSGGNISENCSNRSLPIMKSPLEQTRKKVRLDGHTANSHGQ